MTRATCLILLLSIAYTSLAQPSQKDIYRVLAEINKLRSDGYVCGNKRMRPVPPVEWNHQLYVISNDYARYMAKYDHFDHISLDGKDIGDRLNEIGYSWVKVGENLGFGYFDFYSVLEAWKKSPSHCEMLLDPDVTHMGLSKHKVYWVQSFSKAPSPFATTNDRF